MDKQTGKFIARIAENLPNLDKDAMQRWIEHPTQLYVFLLGMKLQVRVDRSVSLNCPEHFKDFIHPVRECYNPVDYNLGTNILFWELDFQSMGDDVPYSKIYEYFEEAKKIRLCLNMHDGLAIQSMGIAVFRSICGERRSLILLGSVARYDDGTLHVPVLCIGPDSRVIIVWKPMSSYFSVHDSAPFFHGNILI